MKLKYLNLRLPQYWSFVICMALMLVVPIWRDHKIFGIDLGTTEEDQKIETLSVLDDGEVVINTTELGKKIIGYAGPTPLEIHIQDNKITRIIALENQETPEFYGAVINSPLFKNYYGLTLEQASQLDVDAVTGATFTSTAMIKNINEGVKYALNEADIPAKIIENKREVDWKFVVTIIIILSGSIIPLFLKNRQYRNCQLILNVILLGFWGGTFISYSQMMSYFTNGITNVLLIPAALMLVSAFIYPFFGKPNHYCNWICPYGSLQELLGKCCPVKLKIPQKVNRLLMHFRDILWFALMWLLWTGLWFDWMEYEPFAAFFFRDASAITLSIAGAFLLLSLFVQRPYCRFVCPTGTLFKLAEGEE